MVITDRKLNRTGPVALVLLASFADAASAQEPPAEAALSAPAQATLPVPNTAAPPAATSIPPSGPPPAASPPASPTEQAAPVDTAPPASAPADLGPVTPPSAPASELGLGRRIPIGAYGEAHFTHQGDKDEVNLRRFVLFVGYRFAEWARLYSEIEIENASELELEQAYLELSPHRRVGIRVGLVPIPLGIINLYHEPPTFNGVDRPAVDQLILPSTWRELGVGLYGELIEGLQYQLYFVNGLDGDRFSARMGIGPGRGQGSEAHFQDGAVTGRVNFNRVLGLDVAAGFYYGGAGQDVSELGGVKVGIVEADARFARWGLQLRAEYARVFIEGADRITAFQRATDPAAPAIASAEQGYYAEAGYNVLWPFRRTEQELVPFARYENVDLRASLPAVAAPGPAPALQFLTAGVTYRPLRQLAFKLDYRRTLAGRETIEGGEPASANRVMAGAAFMF